MFQNLGKQEGWTDQLMKTIHDTHEQLSSEAGLTDALYFDNIQLTDAQKKQSKVVFYKKGKRILTIHLSYYGGLSHIYTETASGIEENFLFDFGTYVQAREFTSSGKAEIKKAIAYAIALREL